MSASVCSSSAWPTPDASVINDGEGAATFFVRRERVRVTKKNGNGMGIPLTVASVAWPTPTARDHRSGSCSPETAARNARPLSEFVGSIWSTPRASDGEKGGPGQSFGAGGMPLAAQTAQWATPTVKGNHNRAGISPNAGDGLATQAIALSPLPGPAMPKDGESCSPTAPTSPRRLNPSFVEWLMGWPEGWTLLALPPSTACAPIACACSETAFTRWQQRMRSELSALASRRAEVAVQLSLFG